MSSTSAQRVKPHAELRAVIAGLMLAIFLAALDQTIVAVSLPDIARHFNDFESLGWVVAAYMMAMTLATPIYGKLGDLYGRRNLLLLAIATFTLASVLCALSRSMPQLIVARVVQGLGGGGLIAVSQAVIGDLVAPRDRGRFQGYISGMYALASVAGPALGGLLSTYASWRWIFWLKLPLGFAALLLTARALPRSPRTAQLVAIDYGGALLLTCTLATLLVAISHAVGSGALRFTLLAASIVFMALFIRRERAVAEPLIPVELMRNRTAALSWTIAFFANFVMIALSVLVPLRFQSITGGAADAAALHLLPLVMGVPLGAYLSGRLSSVTARYKPQVLTGALLLPVAVTVVAVSSLSHWLPAGCALLLAGFAVGCQFPGCTVAAQDAAPQRHLGVVTSTLSLLRALGGALGAAAMSSLLLLLMHDAGLGDTLNLTADGAGIAAMAPALAPLFRDLLLIAAAISVLGSLAALALPDRRLRGAAAIETRIVATEKRAVDE